MSIATAPGNPGEDGKETDPKPRAHRIGIAPASGCAAALDRKAADILTRHHCRAMLRATYVDE